MNVRVYGLPRSGTNYLEYLIINNTDLIYKNRHHKESKYTNKLYKKEIHIKHCEPKEDEDIDLFLIIVKDLPNFIRSYKKWDNKEVSVITDTYNIAISDYINFKKILPQKVVVLSYEILLGNELHFFQQMSDDFGFNLTAEFMVPIKRMWKNNGKTLMNEKFHIPNTTVNTTTDIYKQFLQLKVH